MMELGLKIIRIFISLRQLKLVLKAQLKGNFKFLKKYNKLIFIVINLNKKIYKQVCTLKFLK